MNDKEEKTACDKAWAVGFICVFCFLIFALFYSEAQHTAHLDELKAGRIEILKWEDRIYMCFEGLSVSPQENARMKNEQVEILLSGIREFIDGVGEEEMCIDREVFREMARHIFYGHHYYDKLI
jgi:hypothetical protein